jgi:putative RecB family exonuclease
LFRAEASPMKFINEHLSFSRLSRYEQCALAFRLHYIDKFESVPGLPLLFGKAIHAVLEELLSDIVEARLTGPLLEARALELWRDQWMAEGRLHGADVFQEGADILRDFCREEGVVDHRAVLGIERDFELMIGRFKVVGSLDRVNRKGDEEIEIVDYKTNRLLFSRDEVDSSLQMSLYQIAAHELWPWAKTVKLTFQMLRHSIRMETTRTPEQLEAAKAYVVMVGERIERATEFPARLNTNCAYCDHKAHCATYAQALAGKNPIVGSHPADLAAVAREREDVASIAKLAYARKSELDEQLKTHIDEQGELVIAGRKYHVYTASSVSYPFEATVTRLAAGTGLSVEDVAKRVSVIDKTALDGFIKEQGERLSRSAATLLRLEVDAKAKRTFSQRFSSRESK